MKNRKTIAVSALIGICLVGIVVERSQARAQGTPQAHGTPQASLPPGLGADQADCVIPKAAGALKASYLTPDGYGNQKIWTVFEDSAGNVRIFTYYTATGQKKCEPVFKASRN